MRRSRTRTRAIRAVLAAVLWSGGGGSPIEVNPGPGSGNAAVIRTYWLGGHARCSDVTGAYAFVANEGGWVDILPF